VKPSSRLARLLRLSTREKRHASSALAWLILAHLALHAVSFGRIRRWVDGLESSATRRSPGLDECVRAVARARVLFPPAQCLAASLAAECMLRRAGRVPRMIIDMRFDPTHLLEAHAWVECEGITIT
jgi:hypothetical protein